MKKALLVMLASAAVACGGGDASLPEQVGEACTDIGDVICERAADCGLIAQNEQLACTNEFYAACCADSGACGNPLDPTITQSEWNDCLDAVETESCNDINQGNLPTECLSL